MDHSPWSKKCMICTPFGGASSSQLCLCMRVYLSILSLRFSTYLKTFYFHHVCVKHFATNHQWREPSLKAAIALLISHFPIYRPALVFSPPSHSQPPLWKAGWTTCSQLHFTESSPRKGPWVRWPPQVNQRGCCLSYFWRIWGETTTSPIFTYKYKNDQDHNDWNTRLTPLRLAGHKVKVHAVWWHLRHFAQYMSLILMVHKDETKSYTCSPLPCNALGDDSTLWRLQLIGVQIGTGKQVK